jgi:hypothetical protein
LKVCLVIILDFIARYLGLWLFSVLLHQRMTKRSNLFNSTNLPSTGQTQRRRAKNGEKILAYSDGITKELCISIATSILAGFDYDLIVPNNGRNVVVDGKFGRIKSLLHELNMNWGDHDNIIFAHAFDVLFSTDS